MKVSIKESLVNKKMDVLDGDDFDVEIDEGNEEDIDDYNDDNIKVKEVSNDLQQFKIPSYIFESETNKNELT